MTRDGDKQGVLKEIPTQAAILGGLVLLAWGLELFDLFVLRQYGPYLLAKWNLTQFGIIPRNLIGLRGILFAPFLHVNLAHLIGNTIPFIILGWLIMLRETSDFFVVSIISALVGGLGTWLFGSPSTIHIGASGVIFGYLGYLLFRGYFERKPLSIAMSLFVLVLYRSLLWGLLPFQYGILWGVLFGCLGYLLFRGYFERKPLSIAMSLFMLVLSGSLIWGLLPFQYGISWEGHLFGFLGGGVSAKMLARDNQSVKG